MQKTRTILSSAATLTAALFLLVSVPAFAEGGSGDSGGSSDTTTTTTTEANMGEMHHSHMADAVKTEATDTTTTDDSTTSGDVHTRGAKLLAQAEANHKGKAKSAEARKQTCEAHKQGLQQKFTRITSNGEKMQAKIDGVFQKAQDYKTANNVSLSNYDTLVAAATTAQSNSAASLAALKTVTPTLDCNSTSVASDVATFKAAAQTARDNLKAYRTAVKALLTALAGVKTETTTTGGTQ